MKRRKPPQATPPDLALCPARSSGSGQIAQMPVDATDCPEGGDMGAARAGVAWGAGKMGERYGGWLRLGCGLLDQLGPDHVPIGRKHVPSGHTALRHLLDDHRAFGRHRPSACCHLVQVSPGHAQRRHEAGGTGVGLDQIVLEQHAHSLAFATDRSSAFAPLAFASLEAYVDS